MRPNKLKALWREGKPATAGWLSTGNPYLAEVMANAGYDAIIIDMQHGMGVTADRAIACLQAISTTDTVPVVRMPWNDPQSIQFVLDAGAYGVIVPLVNTYEEAVQAVGASRYPPLGYRSIGPNRARLYAGADYAQHANEEIIVLVMVETLQSVENLEEMAKVPGLDGFYIGPADLAISIGITPGPDAAADPRHAAACQRVVDVANAAGLVPCHHGSGPDEAARRFAQGFKMCQIGSDAGMVGAGAAAALKAVAEAQARG
ncbi:MAG: aldolase/citrate lyase family protein [Dehalococcoidia bacterium]